MYSVHIHVNTTCTCTYVYTVNVLVQIHMYIHVYFWKCAYYVHIHNLNHYSLTLTQWLWNECVLLLFSIDVLMCSRVLVLKYYHYMYNGAAQLLFLWQKFTRLKRHIKCGLGDTSTCRYPYLEQYPVVNLYNTFVFSCRSNYFQSHYHLYIFYLHVHVHVNEFLACMVPCICIINELRDH